MIIFMLYAFIQFLSVEEQINKEIDQLVKRQVSEELERYIPKKLRDEVSAQKQQLLTVKCELHNSESCRANGLIKTENQINDVLHTVVNDKYATFPFFPKNMNALEELNDEKTRELVKFYGLREPFGSKVANWNWFLRKCGVGYQYVNPRK
jgi:DNA topoisomerase VI subunit B